MAIIATAQLKSLAIAWQGQIQHGRHQYLTDKPASFGGQDAGPAPYEFLLASLISCTMITLRMYAQHKGIELGEFRVEADFKANKEGEEWIERRIQFENNLETALSDKLLTICEKTPVTKTLLRSLKIQTLLLND